MVARYYVGCVKMSTHRVSGMDLKNLICMVVSGIGRALSSIFGRFLRRMGRSSGLWMTRGVML